MRRIIAIAIVLVPCACRRELELPEPQTQPPARTDVVAPAVANAGPGDLPEPAPPAGIAKVIAQVDPAELRASVDRLVGFGTRHTLSDTVSPTRGIGAARKWIHERFAAASIDRGGAAPLAVAFDSHRTKPDGKRIDREVDVVNVVATLPGTLPAAASRHYYVLAHYDSRASDPMDATSDAPGANDDGSGVALLLELARVLAPRQLDATIVLVATAGEEQGLVGARAHAKAAKHNGTDVRAVLSFDIVGDPSMPDGSVRRDAIRVFSEGIPMVADAAAISELRTLGGESDSRSRELARHVAMVAAWHHTAVQPMLVFRPDRFLRGGDHTAFAEQGFAALRFTELGEEYDRQHQDVRVENGRKFGDTAEHVDPHYLAELTRMVAATLVHLANAPSAPADAKVIAAELTMDTTITWAPAPEPDVAGYEVVWRATTDGHWQHARDAGNATTITLPLHKDDWLFGVRSYDAEGYRSEVAFCGALRPAK
ncbi:MAG TPA: M28 family metallopeptidase [Nannocystaceae bacterium]|nr:M28 family metallopeptidase [Nannocystaceae bacterium]